MADGSKLEKEKNHNQYFCWLSDVPSQTNESKEQGSKWRKLALFGGNIFQWLIKIINLMKILI